MHRLNVAAALSITLSAGAARTQMATNAPVAPAPTTMADPAKAADSVLSGFESEMMSAANAMPAEKYDFSPASLNLPGSSFSGVRTFADQVKHVAQANYSIYAGVMGTKPDVDVKAIGSLQGKDKIVAALAASFAYAHKAIATITVANQGQAVGKSQSKETLALYGVAHGFDHYGQMVEYLRMNGIVPPASVK